jgi:hypothetical protein
LEYEDDVIKQEYKTKTCKRSIPRVAEPSLVGSSPFSARSYRYIHA